MATYTPPYPPKVKESINVDFKDRWTAQKVKFINRENEFYGTFYGTLNLSATNISGFIIDDSEFNNGRITNSTLANSFVITDSGEQISFDSIISSQNRMSADVGKLFIRINNLEDQVSANYKSIEDIYKKITGGLSFRGVLSIDHSYASVKNFLGEKLEDYSKKLDSGWYYLVETNPVSSHYTIEGLDVSYRDCLVIKNTNVVNSITSSDIVIYDMMDKDAVHIDLLQEVSSYLDNRIDHVNGGLSNFYLKSETSSCNELSDEFNEVYKKIDETSSKIDFSDYYRKSETSSSQELSIEFKNTDDKIESVITDYVKGSELSGKIGDNVNFWYDKDNLSIYLSAGNKLYGVDTTDFIQDNLRNIKFIGHVNIHKEYNEGTSSLVDIFNDNNLFEHGKVLNGSFYNIDYKDLEVSSKLSTTDGFVFGDGDYLIFHEHSKEKFIDIRLSSTYVVKCGASRYEIDEILKSIRDINLFTVLSTDNTFTGRNEFTNGISTNDIFISDNLSVGFSKIYDTGTLYLSSIFDKLDDNPFVLEIANRTVDVLNITGLSNDVHFNISSDDVGQMVESISSIATYAGIEIDIPIESFTFGYMKYLLNDSIDKLSVDGKLNTLKTRFDMINSNISYIQNRIQYDEYRLNELSGLLNVKVSELIENERDLLQKINTLSTDLEDNYYDKTYLDTEFNRLSNKLTAEEDRATGIEEVLSGDIKEISGNVDILRDHVISTYVQKLFKLNDHQLTGDDLTLNGSDISVISGKYKGRTIDSALNQVSIDNQTYVDDVINGLDVDTITIGSSKTVESISQTDGKISVNSVDINILPRQVSGLPEIITSIEDQKANKVDLSDYIPLSAAATKITKDNKVATLADIAGLSGVIHLRGTFENNELLSNKSDKEIFILSCNPVSKGDFVLNSLNSKEYLAINDCVVLSSTVISDLLSNIIEIGDESLYVIKSFKINNKELNGDSLILNGSDISVLCGYLSGMSIDNAFDTLSGCISSHIDKLSDDYYRKEETSSKTEISQKFNELKEYSDTKISLLSGISSDSYSSNLSVIKLTNEEYGNLVLNDQINESALYVIDDDHVDARGQRITNVSTPISSYDATTKQYVDDVVSGYIDKIKEKIQNSLSVLSGDVDNIKIGQVVSALYNLREIFS